MGRREVVEIEYEPRPLQLEFHDRKERFAILVCHRRFGKTVAAINDLIRAAITCPYPDARVAYIAPQFSQAKRTAWDFTKKFSRPIPGMKYNEAELRADFPNGARMSLYGGENPDALRGVYLDYAVMDEYAQMSERVWEEIIRPALSDRKGKATFIGTPMGHNAFFDLYEKYKDDPEWYVRIHRSSETGYVDKDELESALKNMSDERFRQEYECSWAAAIQGAYYGRLLEEAEKKGRIRNINADPGIPVETWWDLGIGDSTAIWFAQRSGPEIRLIDFYENSGEPLAHYAQVLKEKASAGKWVYGEHVVPHDAQQRSLDTGNTRLQTLKNLGIEAKVQAASKLEDGIEAARRMLPNCWFDAIRCAPGLNALRQYRAEYDEKNRTFRLRPVHDWASHAADAFRYGAMHKPSTRSWTKIEYDNRGIV